MLNKLVAHTIETGAVTAITAGVDLALFLLYKQEFVHLVPYVFHFRYLSQIIESVQRYHIGQTVRRDVFSFCHSSLHSRIDTQMPYSPP